MERGVGGGVEAEEEEVVSVVGVVESEDRPGRLRLREGREWKSTGQRTVRDVRKVDEKRNAMGGDLRWLSIWQRPRCSIPR